MIFMFMSWQIVECLLRKITFCLKVFYSYISIADMGAYCLRHPLNGKERQTVRTDKRTDKQPDRHNVWADKRTDKQTDRHSIQTDKRTDKQPDRPSWEIITYIDYRIWQIIVITERFLRRLCHCGIVTMQCKYVLKSCCYQQSLSSSNGLS